MWKKSIEEFGKRALFSNTRQEARNIFECPSISRDLRNAHLETRLHHFYIKSKVLAADSRGTGATPNQGSTLDHGFRIPYPSLCPSREKLSNQQSQLLKFSTTFPRVFLLHNLNKESLDHQE